MQTLGYFRKTMNESACLIEIKCMKDKCFLIFDLFSHVEMQLKYELECSIN